MYERGKERDRSFFQLRKLFHALFVKLTGRALTRFDWSIVAAFGGERARAQPRGARAARTNGMHTRERDSASLGHFSRAARTLSPPLRGARLTPVCLARIMQTTLTNYNNV